jgi:WD40 repeat protein
MWSACFSPDGRHALGASGDGTLTLWRLANGDCLSTLAGHMSRATGACFLADGRHAVSVSHDRTLRIWDVEHETCVRTLEGSNAELAAVAVSRDGSCILSGGKDGTLMLWDLDWEIEEKQPADWHESARPYLDVFLALHSRRILGVIPWTSWSERDFEQLMAKLCDVGFGWLKREGVHRELRQMARSHGRPNLG